MVKRQNKPREMPELSRLDKVIYWCLGLLLFAGLVGLIVLWMHTATRIHFSVEDVVAVRSRMSFLLAFPAFFSLFATALGLWCWGYNGRYPIFGIPGFLYGPPLPRIYPLFMKNRPKRKPGERRGRLRFAAFIAAVNLVCLALVPLSFEGRDSWYADGRVEQISIFGTVETEYDVRDTEAVLLSVYSYTNRNSIVRHWAVRVELVMADGRRFDYPTGSFRFDDGSQVRPWIRDLQQVLSRYPEQIIAVEGAADLEQVIAEDGLNEQEEQILRTLFRAE